MAQFFASNHGCNNMQLHEACTENWLYSTTTSWLVHTTQLTEQVSTLIVACVSVISLIKKFVSIAFR